MMTRSGMVRCCPAAPLHARGCLGIPYRLPPWLRRPGRACVKWPPTVASRTRTAAWAAGTPASQAPTVAGTTTALPPPALVTPTLTCPRRRTTAVPPSPPDARASVSAASASSVRSTRVHHCGAHEHNGLRGHARVESVPLQVSWGDAVVSGAVSVLLTTPRLQHGSRWRCPTCMPHCQSPGARASCTTPGSAATLHCLLG